MQEQSGSLKNKVQKLFNKGCTEYGLLEDNDRILIALSGGKDSLVLTRLMAERARIWKPRIQVEAAHVVMDNIPYETDRSYLETFCNELGIKFHLLHGRFDESTDPRKTKCFLCAWNRRKLLFNFAVDNGFNKVALGHHMDDIITTWLMNVTFEGSNAAMKPMLQLEHYPLSIIRPLCLVHENMLKEYAEQEHFAKLKVPCPYEDVTRRNTMNTFFHQLEDINPEARYSLWRAMQMSK